MRKVRSKLQKGVRVNVIFHFSFVSGKAAWLLYDTYGFPIDLTTLIMEEKGMTINMAEYEEEKKKAQVLAIGSEQVERGRYLCTGELARL